MAYDIGNQFRHLGITDRSDDSVAQFNDKDHALDSTTTEHHRSPSSIERQAKETRRVSLPADVHQRRSKFSSWVQHNLPTPPSSRNNSNGSQHSNRSKARPSSSSSSSTVSDHSTPTYVPSPTSSPTLTHSPPPPVPPHLHPVVPPRSSSLPFDPAITSRSSPPPLATNEDDYQHHDEETPNIPHHQRSSSTCSSSSTNSNNNNNKKKRFTLPRVRLCQSEKCCKRKHREVVDPPEPPPQLLVTALHHCNQEKINKKKSASQNNLDDQEQHQHQQKVQQPVVSSPPPCYDNQEPPLALTKEGTSHLSSAELPPHSASYQRRRRSSCPSKYSANITVQESVMLQSFCSPVHSPHITTSSLQQQRRRPRTPTTPSVPSPAPSPSTSSVSIQQEDVYDHDQQCLLSFSSMKPRSRPLKRRTSGKKEKKAFRVWHDSLVDALKESQPEDTLSSSNRASSTSSMEQQSALSKEKRERNALTRKFILSEFYLTEVTFWNQLYYSKVMFGDPLQKSLERQSPFSRSSDMDVFSNLPDLMQCSSQLIRAMTPFLDQPASSALPSLSPSSSISTSTVSPRTPDTFDFNQRPASYTQPTSSPSSSTVSLASSTKRSLPVHLNADTRTLPSPNDQLMLGKELCAMASQFVVFLRCALDYRHNRKRLDHRAQHNKGFAVYQEKLALRRETNQFYVHDFLIIPIQRITRYGLLLADLQKHTERHHPDYHWLGRARMILTALAVAMNKAQQK